MFARRRSGFTLTELLVVIAIIGVLVSLLLPAVQMAREAARRSQCTSNLRQCGMAIVNYATAKGHMPAARSRVAIAPGPPIVYEKLGWVYPVLGELEQAALQLDIRNGELPTEPTPIPVLKCPSQAIYGSSEFPLSYVVNGGRANRVAPLPASNNFDWLANGAFVDHAPLPDLAKQTGQDKIRIDEIAKYDGTSTTLMLSENPSVKEWLRAPKEQYSQMLWFVDDPATLPPAFIGLNQLRKASSTDLDGSNRYGRPASGHPGGFMVVMCDNSVQFMNESTNYRVYAALMTSRGERANSPDNSTFAATDPPWQAPTDLNYPGVSF